MFSKPIFFLLVFAAVFASTVFVVRLDMPRDFLGKAGALLSETFGDVFGNGNQGAPAVKISLEEEEPPIAGNRLDAEAPLLTVAKVVPEDLLTSKPVSISPSKNVPSSAGAIDASKKGSSGAVMGSKSAEEIQVPECVFSSGSAPSRATVFNEVAWMGSPPRGGESTAAAANNEWIELKNVGTNEINLAGWQILDESTNFRIIFDGGVIPISGFYFLERTDDGSVPGISADKIYSGALSNSGVWLRLFDPSCGLIDEIDGRAGWLAGDNPTKRTMERRTDLSGSTALTTDWQTSASAGGTPRAENSQGQSSASASTTATTASQTATTKYNLAVSIQGDGTGKIVSNPAGINCGFDCIEEFYAGTTVALTAAPEPNSSFEGWSEVCSFKSDCKLTISGNVSVSATFKSTIPSQSAPPPPPPQAAAGGKVLISEIMTGSDISADDEFIELYNPTNAAIDLTGWMLKKRTSTGSTSTLVVASRLDGKSILAGKHFLLAREGGYSGAIVPDALWPASSAYALAYTNNAIMFYDAGGAIVEEISWTEIPKNQSYERQPPAEGGQFVVQPTPNPQNSGQ